MERRCRPAASKIRISALASSITATEPSERRPTPLIVLNHCASSLSSLPTRKMGSSPRVQVASEREGSLVTISTPALSVLMVISWDSTGPAAPARARARPAAMAVGASAVDESANGSMRPLTFRSNFTGQEFHRAQNAAG